MSRTRDELYCRAPGSGQPPADWLTAGWLPKQLLYLSPDCLFLLIVAFRSIERTQSLPLLH